MEYLIQHQDIKQYFHNTVYQPENGLVALPDLPGLGISWMSRKFTSKNC